MKMSGINYKPEGFHSVTPYLTVQGASRLIEFLKQAFGAEQLGVYPKPDGTIGHACMKVGNSMVELADGTDQWPPMPCALHVYVPNVDIVHEQAVKAGGISLHAPVDQVYGERSSVVRDMCGNNWYIATRTETLTEEEIVKRTAQTASQ
jgi:uncharacterized glyoxalase superfamily protein PhnB